MLAYYLKAQPHLFKDAIEEQFTRLRDQRDSEAKRQSESKPEDSKSKSDKSELVLYR